MGYDGAGRLITQTLAGPTSVTAPLSSTYGYSYTATSWTSGLTSTLNGITTTQTITHDAQGRLTAASGGGTSQSWSYDGNGNLLTSALTTSGGTTTTSYGYTQAITPNAMLTVTTPGQPATYYGYDQHGNTTSITNGGTLNTGVQYDAQAHPITVTLADGSQVSLGYNADGLRASYIVSKGGNTSLSERFQYRDSELAQASVVSGTQAYTDTYVYDPTGSPLELLRTNTSGTTSRYWYQVDGRGNVVALTDINGNVVDRYSYDLWGYPTTTSESVPQQLRYGGYWWDAQLAWYWVSVRYYDPNLKRWLQPDPSAQDGVHTYAYVSDDPVDYTDPSGLDGRPTPCSVYTSQTLCGGKAMTPPRATPTPNPNTQASNRRCIGCLALAGLVTVGRWMSRTEYDKMVSTGFVQESYSGATNVTYPPNPTSFLPQGIGNVFAKFKVPLARLVRTAGHGGGRWYRIATAKTIDGRLATRKGEPLPPEEMPEAVDPEIAAENTAEGIVYYDESVMSADASGDPEGQGMIEGGNIPGEDRLGGIGFSPRDD